MEKSGWLWGALRARVRRIAEVPFCSLSPMFSFFCFHMGTPSAPALSPSPIGTLKSQVPPPSEPAHATFLYPENSPPPKTPFPQVHGTNLHTLLNFISKEALRNFRRRQEFPTQPQDHLWQPWGNDSSSVSYADMKAPHTGRAHLSGGLTWPIASAMADTPVACNNQQSPGEKKGVK